jgi:hypothetical protein
MTECIGGRTGVTSEGTFVERLACLTVRQALAVSPAYTAIIGGSLTSYRFITI